MDSTRSALYLDFDNVFSALLKVDPNAALVFAQEPERWLSRLSSRLLTGEPRRWLLLRCYLNPEGSVSNSAGNGERHHFSMFRRHFTDAGFEVIDCPRLAQTKNGADIRLVLDAAEALRADVHYDEFIIASGDSDMTPLLVRLRAADRRTVVMSPRDVADVLEAVADLFVGSEDILDLLETTSELEDGLADDALVDGTAGMTAVADSQLEGAKQRFRMLVTQRYTEATEPLSLGSLGAEIRKAIGPATTTSGWFGLGGFTSALRSLELPYAQFSQHYVWDGRRHAPPSTNGPTTNLPSVPVPVERVSKLLKLPNVRRDVWPHIYEGLAEYVTEHDFTMADTTRWVRDKLNDEGVPASRQTVGLVVRGSSYGGRPLYAEPPPSAQEIGTAFIDNVLSRAADEGAELTGGDTKVIRAWLGEQKLGGRR